MHHPGKSLQLVTHMITQVVNPERGSSACSKVEHIARALPSARDGDRLDYLPILQCDNSLRQMADNRCAVMITVRVCLNLVFSKMAP